MTGKYFLFLLHQLLQLVLELILWLHHIHIPSISLLAVFLSCSFADIDEIITTHTYYSWYTVCVCVCVCQEPLNTFLMDNLCMLCYILKYTKICDLFTNFLMLSLSKRDMSLRLSLFTFLRQRQSHWFYEIRIEERNVVI